MNPDTQKLLEESTRVAQEAARVSGQTFIPGFNAGAPITSIDLQPQAQANITQPAPETLGVGEGARFEASAQAVDDNFTRQQEIASKKAEADSNESLQDLIGGLTQTPGQTELTSQAFAQEGGVNDIQEELNTVNQQLKEEELSRRRQVEQREKNLEGTFGGAVAQDIAKINSESFRRQADLSIIQQGIQGRFDSARQIADRAVAVQLERQKNRITALQLNYEANKDLFDKKEQRAFESAQADRKRKLDKEETRLEEINSVGLEFLKAGGDSATARDIFNSKTTAEALQKTGNIFGMTARLQREKLLKDINEVTTGFLTGKDKFDAQLKLADKFAARSGDYKKATIQIGGIRASYELAKQADLKGESLNAASQGVLVAFQKLLDPTSVVRESEYARSGDGLGLVSRLEGQFTKLKQGGAGVTASDLKEFVVTAETFLRGYEDTAIDDAQLIISQATPAGLDIAQIIPNSVLDLMESRFREALETLEAGQSTQIGGRTFQKQADGNLIEI